MTCGITLKSDDFGLPGRRKGLRAVGLLVDYTRRPNPISVPDTYTIRIYGEGDVGPADSIAINTGLMDDGGGHYRLYAMKAPGPQTRYQVEVFFTTVDEITLKEIKVISIVSKRLGQPQ